MSNPTGVSVLICTRNGKKNLGPTLQHLAAQKNIAAIDTELVIVDNDSTDGTADFVRQTWETLGNKMPLRIVNEGRQGKGYASVTGYNTVKYELIIICDDDNWLDENYISLAYGIMMGDKNIGALGGQSEGVFEGEKPLWFKEQQHIFAIGTQASNNGQLHDFLWGAGMIFRKDVWDKLNQLNFTFLLNTQRSEKLVASGEDTELCEMIIWLGYKLWYDDRLTLKHYMPTGRMTVDYLKKYYRGLGRGRLYMQAYVYYRTHNTPPYQQLKYPFWLDKFLHRSKELLNFLPQALFYPKNKYNTQMLRYLTLTSELNTLVSLKDEYKLLYEKIEDLKKRIAELKK